MQRIYDIKREFHIENNNYKPRLGTDTLEYCRNAHFYTDLNEEDKARNLEYGNISLDFQIREKIQQLEKLRYVITNAKLGRENIVKSYDATNQKPLYALDYANYKIDHLEQWEIDGWLDVTYNFKLLEKNGKWIAKTEIFEPSIVQN
jgi:hypothetical protein